MRCAGKHMKGVTGCACEGSKSLLLHFCRHRFGKKATQALGDRGKGRSWASHLGLCSSCHPGSHSPAPAIVPIPGLRDRACVPVPPDHHNHCSPGDTVPSSGDTLPFYFRREWGEGKRSSLSGVCTAHTFAERMLLLPRWISDPSDEAEDKK